ncbi:hypothetical protein [Rhodovarius lipocyclicus]|uniref:hypothetical protein n=1 Tax=Rhodovarius lipocyclicus TaxID=268410 RepID=UPI0013570817|nr:hypothetical protein [Rhodovarius lipocyclicus]
MHRILPLLLILPALAGCSRVSSILPGGSSGQRGYDLQELTVSSPIFGEIIRAAAVCQMPVSLTAQDRAARIEAAALLAFARQGGDAARNQYLASVQPPNFDPARRGQDRSQYCGQKRLDIERADTFLNGAEGQSLAERADNARRALGQ